MLLLLKLILVPLLIAAVTLATRKWGARVAGVLAALPIVAGPTLCFFAIEQGGAFASGAARATLLGLVAVAAFTAAYFSCSMRFGWTLSLAAGWLAFGLVTGLLFTLRVSVLTSFACAIAALTAVRLLIPAPRAANATMKIPSWDIPARMLAAASLVFTVTFLAGKLGPNLSGLLTPFPVAIAILAAFEHAQLGWKSVARFFRGFLPALWSFAVFCLVFSMTVETHTLPITLLLSLTAQLIAQGVILRMLSEWERH
ncbi:MAG: hypothetical protein EXQ56_10615 [Acidobacteria bacterium]|nr:hypothetical protein [Acidobacteriota bacterium]